MRKTFKEPDPQRDLEGEQHPAQDGAKVILRGKGKHFEKFAKQLREAGMLEDK